MRGLRQDHLLAVEVRLLAVDQAVERRVLLARDALAGVEHRVEGLARMVGKTRALLQRLGPKPLVEQEIQGVAQGGGHAEIMVNPALQGPCLVRDRHGVPSPPTTLNPLAPVRLPRAKVLLLGHRFKMRNFSKEPSWPQP
jgi:hypothetical protein